MTKAFVEEKIRRAILVDKELRELYGRLEYWQRTSKKDMYEVRLDVIELAYDPITQSVMDRIEAQILAKEQKIRKFYESKYPATQNLNHMTVQDAISHIDALYPPDSEYEGTRAIGRDLMDNTVGNAVGYNNWRLLPDADLIALARACLNYESNRKI